LSNVYNTLGYTINEENNVKIKDTYPLYTKVENSKVLLKRNYITYDDFGWISSDEIYTGYP